MFEFKKLSVDDYEDIIDISKDIWEGSDYLPEVYHKWIDDRGYFLGLVDKEKNKVVGVSKFSILSDNSGWLEGLRVHKDYRGLKLARLISEKIMEIASAAYSRGEINKIAFSSHISNKESITLMGKLGFKLAQSQILVTKESEAFNKALDKSMFKLEKWELSYDDFISLELLKRRNNILPLAFVFQEPTPELFEEMKRDGAFVIINGFKGIVKIKGEVNFITADESIEAINTFMNYYILDRADKAKSDPPFTYVLEEDKNLIEDLKQNDFTSWNEWKPDYLYFVFG